MSAALEAATSTAWAASIRAAWQKSVAAIIDTGRLLAAAKAELPHGDFQYMVRKKLPFGTRTAQMLMAIAANPMLADANHGACLPTSWHTLYDLSRLKADELAIAIDQKLIDGDTERKDVERIRAAACAKLGRRVRERQPPLPAEPRSFVARLRQHLDEHALDALAKDRADQLLDDVAEFIERSLRGTSGELMVRLWNIDRALGRVRTTPDDAASVDTFARKLFGVAAEARP